MTTKKVCPRLPGVELLQFNMTLEELKKELKKNTHPNALEGMARYFRRLKHPLKIR
jgi:hypothetical protein